MLHAFHNGSHLVGSSDAGFDLTTGMPVYNAGNGEELWAFVPTDLLPKLRYRMGKHAYFVDATPMVRRRPSAGDRVEAVVPNLASAPEASPGQPSNRG